MREQVRFDNSLIAFVDLVAARWGESSIHSNVFLRDAVGRLTFVVIDSSHDGESRAKLAKEAADLLGNYVDADGFAVATPEELFDDSLRDQATGWAIPVESERFSGTVRLIDRRVVGADWLRTPASAPNWPVRLVFASLKGGVGRSTALCVLASHLAARGLRVLTVDMDLEAPGLGNMLLLPDTLPEFGLLDYLVETALNPIDQQFYVDMIGHSWLSGGKGTVDVIPALGSRSLKTPINVLAKIARAYLEQSTAQSGTSTVTDRMEALLQHISDQSSHDVILIDARAGLHETTATAVAGLGAEVFLFGIDQPQTFAAYELLFSHLATLPGEDWRDRLHIVHAKADLADEHSRDNFALQMVELMSRYIWPEHVPNNVGFPDELKDVFDIEWDEDIDDDDIFFEVEHVSEPVVAIGENSEFRTFDPRTAPDRLTESVYGAVFGPFLQLADSLISQATPQGQGVAP